MSVDASGQWPRPSQEREEVSRSTSRPGEPADWEHLKEAEWSRLVEALVTAHHADIDPDAVVTPIDGRGGDGGIDILVERGDGGITVYQLKLYPEGFDGKAYNHRRPKITDSLQRAIRSTPALDEWILVYPGRPTRPGTDFIKGLQSDAADVQIRVWHRNILDTLCAKHQNVVTAVLRQGEYFIENMKALNAGQAVIGNLNDLHSRLGTVSQLTEEVSPDWALDYSKNEHGITTTLRAKNPRAHINSPIQIHFNVDPSEGEAPKSLRRVLGFGAPGIVTIDGEHVHDFKVDGPEWLTTRGALDRLEIHAPGKPPQEGAPGLRLTIRRDDTTLGAFMGKVQHFGTGDHGESLTARFADLVEIEFLLDHGTATQGGSALTVTTDLSDPTVRQARDAARLLVMLHQSNGLTLEVNGHGALGRIEGFTSVFDEDYVEELTAIRETCADLLTVGEHLGTEFDFPREISDWDRIRARTLRLALEGNWVAAGPGPAHATFTLGADPGEEDSQTGFFFAGEVGQIQARHADAKYELLGQELAIGTLVLWHPTMQLDVPPDRNFIIGHEYVIQATDGTPFRMAIAERVTPDRSDISDKPRIEPWALLGITEPDLSGSTE